MGRAETLAGVREKYPQYVDMSDDQLGSALASKYPEYADLASPAAPAAPSADTRSGFTRLYQDYLAKPATKAVSRGLMDPLTEPLVAASRVASGEPMGQVARSYLQLTPEDVRAARATKAATPVNPLAEAVVPQTPLQAGMMAGTGGAGIMARGLRPGLQALARITGGAVGGEAGNQLEGGPTGRGAAVGGGGAAAGEGLGALISRLRLALPGGKAAANRADASRIGQTVEDIVPELGGVRTTPQIRAMTEGGGQAALGQAKEGTTRAIEQALPGRQIPTPAPLRGETTYGPAPTPRTPVNPNTPREVPPTPRPYDPETHVTAAPPLAANRPAPYDPTTAGSGPGPRLQSLARDTMPLREANDALTSIGEGAFNQNILDRTAKKAADRRLYGQVTRDISGGLESAAGPEARGAFEAGQTAYSQGSKILDLFKRSGVSDADGFLNVPRLQRLMNNPKNAAMLQRALGPDDFARLEAAVFRGAGRGETDRITSGMGGPLDALMQVLRGQNTGAAQYARIPIATILPNLGSKYVGQNPLALPERLRTILDVGAQRGVGRMAEEP